MGLMSKLMSASRSLRVEVAKFDSAGEITVVGTISRRRAVLGYEINHVRQALQRVRTGSLDAMPQLLVSLETRLEVLAHTIDQTLVELADTDPRYWVMPAPDMDKVNQ